MNVCVAGKLAVKFGNPGATAGIGGGAHATTGTHFPRQIPRQGRYHSQNQSGKRQGANMAKTPDYFAGKTIIITGAGSGIGRATAAIFAREHANVVCADISEAAVRE